MSLPVNIDDYMKYMPLNEDELQDLHLSAIVKARVERLRGCYAFWLRYPRFTVREMVDQDKAMFGVSETQAYDDIHLCQVMLGNLNAASKEFWRWKVNQEIDEDRKAAKAAGADYVGEMDLVEKIQKENWFDFDVVVASPDMMGVVGRLGKVLGPKGLMPSPKAGTVTPDVAKAVQESKAGKVEYRLDKTNIIHCPIGKVSFGPEKLAENFNALMGAIIKAKPAASKGQYIKSCVAASTMGPGVKMNTAKI